MKQNHPVWLWTTRNLLIVRNEDFSDEGYLRLRARIFVDSEAEAMEPLGDSLDGRLGKHGALEMELRMVSFSGLGFSVENGEEKEKKMNGREGTIAYITSK
ncbi:hypothetical protein TIFTF001_015102 [Ficus carica]|uniref:Uncharacterized protein n=1 Tax=Ficus carica TaxID=3494 RepID=A0AA88A524_FICCA|nr:hypothetical protein TIFTF001_015102 [Ficus carica]